MFILDLDLSIDFLESSYPETELSDIEFNPLPLTISYALISNCCLSLISLECGVCKLAKLYYLPCTYLYKRSRLISSLISPLIGESVLALYSSITYA